jgi:hypothetical protein
MLSQVEQATLNLEQARAMRAAGDSYRQIGRRLGLTSNQLSHIRRTLKREKAAFTRLRSGMPQATPRDLPVRHSALPAGLRARLGEAGYRTLGDLADRLTEPDLPAFQTIPGVGPHGALLVRRLLDQFDLVAGSSDLQGAVERLFPELG